MHADNNIKNRNPEITTNISNIDGKHFNLINILHMCVKEKMNHSVCDLCLEHMRMNELLNILHG